MAETTQGQAAAASAGVAVVGAGLVMMATPGIAEHWWWAGWLLFLVGGIALLLALLDIRRARNSRTATATEPLPQNRIEDVEAPGDASDQMRWIDRPVEFYGSMSEYEAKTHGLQAEIARASVAWLAAWAGTRAVGDRVLSTGKIKRVLLMHPRGRYMKQFFAPYLNANPKHIAASIERTTVVAIEAGAEVRWHDGPVINMLVCDPDSESATIRVGGAVAWIKEQIGFKVTRREREDTFNVLKLAFDELWERSERANPS